MGGQPIPQQGRLLPAEEASQLTERLDQAVGVVGVDLAVEGEGRAAATGAVAEPGGHRHSLPFEVVADDRSVAA
jgi:hypothetical protein